MFYVNCVAVVIWDSLGLNINTNIKSKHFHFLEIKPEQLVILKLKLWKLCYPAELRAVPPSVSPIKVQQSLLLAVTCNGQVDSSGDLSLFSLQF